MRNGEVIVAILCACVAAPTVPAAGQLAPFQLEEIGHAGCVECAGAEAFVQVASVSIAPDGRIVVVDTGTPFIRVFAPNGALVSAFGTRGEGPGEFQIILTATARADGSLDILETRLSRLSHVDPNGREIEASRVAHFPLGADFASDRNSLVMVTTDFRSPVAIERMDLVTGLTEQLVRATEDFPIERDGEVSLFPAFAAHDDGSFVLGDGTSDYRLRRYHPDGRLAGEISRPIAREKRTAAEMAAARESRARVSERLARMREREGGRAAAALPPPEIPIEKNHFNARSTSTTPAASGSGPNEVPERARCSTSSTSRTASWAR